MHNEDNLKGHGFDEITAEKQRQIASAGGKASVKAKKAKKQLREYLELLMEKDMGKDADGNPISGAEAMAMRAMNGALKGDWRAWELVRDTSGQKPVEKVMIAEVEQSVIDEVEAIIDGLHD